MNTKILHQHIQALITQITPPPTTPKIIVGLSGGADSVFLLHQLVLLSKQLPLQLVATHLNHGWRGDADATDEQFCRDLATQLTIPFITAHAQNIIVTKPWNGSQEELGRNQRHAFLQNTATQTGAHAIAMGHQAQDQEELFFIRLMRGTSLEGLCGMKPLIGNIIRPLLHVHRQEIEKWLVVAGHTWQHDSDNDNRRFLRNRIRHELLPMLHTMEPRFAATFARTNSLLQEEQALVEEIVAREFEKIFHANNTPNTSLSLSKCLIERAQCTGDLTAFKKLSPMLQRHLFKKLCSIAKAPFPGSLGLIDEALRFLNNPRGGTHQLWDGWALQKKVQAFYLEHSTFKCII